MSEPVRDLGPIEGREVGVAAPPRTGSYRPDEPPDGPPGPLPAVPETPSRLRAARSEVVEALHDVRDAHRRGPKPNSRPLPRWVERLAWVLDDAVEVPGTGGRRVGVDGFLTFIPGVGDAMGFALSMVVVTAGVAAGVSIPTILRMLVNVTFESVVGLIPVGGALFDMAYKANDRNVRLIEADLADRRRTRRSSLAILFALVATTVVGFVLMFVIAVASIAVFVWVLLRIFGAA